MENTVHGIEDVVGYDFKDRNLLSEAITAAGSIVGAGSRHFPDGNKRLAVLGDGVLRLVLAEDWYEGDGTRGKTGTRKSGGAYQLRII